MKKEPTPHSDSELDELVKMIPVWHTIQMQKAMEDGNPKHNKDYQDQAKTALLQWSDRRAEKLVAEADDKAHFIGFKNGKYAATKKVMDLWFTHMISELGYEKATAYKESIQAALTATKEEE